MATDKRKVAMSKKLILPDLARGPERAALDLWRKTPAAQTQRAEARNRRGGRMSDRAYLELWDLTKSYPSPQGEAVIVKNISFKFRKGEFVTIIGHSGCGKSTILMMVAGLSTVTSGGIVLAGKELNGPGPDRGVVFQSRRRSFPG